MVEVKKKEREPLESMLRRFKKKLLESGDLYRARNTRYFERPLSKMKTREKAARRARVHAEKDLLKKLGKAGTKDLPGRSAR